MKKKHLLIISNRFYPQLGGAEINIMHQARELAKEFDVEVATPLRDKKDPLHEKVDGVKITRLKDWYHRGPYPNNNAMTLCPTLFLKILLGRYDLIHCFPALNHNNLLAMAVAKLRGIPIYLTNFDLFDYAAYLEKSPDDISGLFRLKLGKKQKTFLKYFNSIFTISTRENQLIKAINPASELSTVPVILEEFDQPLPLEEMKMKYQLRDAPLLICLSRVCYLKGQDILVHALPLLKQKLDDFQVLIVGTHKHDPNFARRLKRYVQKHGLEEHVIFTGSLPREQALALLKLSDVHVLPMRYMNSGAVVIETWASRRPVLQSDRIDPNYVVEGENGFTFEIENPDDLVDKIVKMTKSKTKCSQMGKKGRKLVEHKFLYPHLIKQYLKAYKTAD